MLIVVVHLLRDSVEKMNDGDDNRIEEDDIKDLIRHCKDKYKLELAYQYW